MQAAQGFEYYAQRFREVSKFLFVRLVERLAIIKPEGTIELDDLPPKYREAQPEEAAETNNVAEAMRNTSANLKEALQNVEQELIGQAMEASDGVVAQAARLLNMRRTTLVEKIGKYNLA